MPIPALTMPQVGDMMRVTMDEPPVFFKVIQRAYDFTTSPITVTLVLGRRTRLLSRPAYRASPSFVARLRLLTFAPSVDPYNLELVVPFRGIGRAARTSAAASVHLHPLLRSMPPFFYAPSRSPLPRGFFVPFWSLRRALPPRRRRANGL